MATPELAVSVATERNAGYLPQLRPANGFCGPRVAAVPPCIAPVEFVAAAPATVSRKHRGEREIPLDARRGVVYTPTCFSLSPGEHMAQKEGTRSKRSRWLFLGGMASIVLGFVLLGLNDRYLAPFLLVAGYLVLVPLSFILPGE